MRLQGKMIGLAAGVATATTLMVLALFAWAFPDGQVPSARGLAGVIGLAAALAAILSLVLAWLAAQLLASPLEREIAATVADSQRSLRRSYTQAIEAVVLAIDARDNDTTGHSFRVARYAVALGRVLGLPRRDLEILEWGALLHDIGKLAVPDAVLWKAGPLTEEEWHIMRQHPAWGAEILAHVEFLKPALEIVANHQERWDGRGYPAGLAANAVPLAARIFAVVDTYDSLTSDRPYRRACTHRTAVSELSRVAGTQLDPDVVDAFLTIPESHLARLKAEASVPRFELASVQTSEEEIQVLARSALLLRASESSTAPRLAAVP